MKHLEQNKEVTRNELLKHAKKDKIDFTSYLSQIVRIYPNVKIINDLSYKESIR